MLINTGRWTFRLIDVPSKEASELQRLYQSSVTKSTFADFEIKIERSTLLRRLIKPHYIINIEGQKPFNPIHHQKLLPSIEWAMNWCVAAYEHTHILFHSSVVEKNGITFMFPARSGAGKSTLSSYLASQDWHLFYDEMAVINPKTDKVLPIYRPTSLKNASIDIIKGYCQTEQLSYQTNATHKGDIAHFMPHSRQAFEKFKATKPSYIVYLNYAANAPLSVIERNKTVGMSHLLTNAFNYSVIGESAFESIVRISNRVTFLDITYSSLSELEHYFNGLVE